MSSSSKYLPVFTTMRYSTKNNGKDIEVSIGHGKFAILESFNGVEISKLVEASVQSSGKSESDDKDAIIADLSNNIADYSVAIRKAANPDATAAAEKRLEDEHKVPVGTAASHTGFYAEIKKKAGADKKKIKVVAMSREGLDEKKKLLKMMFECSIAAGNRLDLSPEEVGEIFASVCPRDTESASSEGGAGAGAAAGGMPDMGAAAQMMEGMLGGMMGGGRGRGGGRGGAGGGAPGGAECQQQ